MKKLYILALLSFMCIDGFPQDTTAKIEFGRANQANLRTFFYYFNIFGNEGYTVYGINGGAKKPQLTRVENDLSTWKCEKYSFELDKLNQLNQNFLYLDHKIIHFASFIDINSNKTFLYYREMNKTTLLPDGAARKLIEVDNNNIMYYNKTEFHFKYSPDSAKIMIVYRNLLNNGTYDGYGINIYDNELNYLWSAGSDLMKKDMGEMSIERWAVSNSGVVYLMCSISNPVKDLYSLSLIKIKDKGTVIVDYPLTLGHKLVKTYNIACNNNNDFICAGMYQVPDDQKSTGVFSVILADKSGANPVFHEAEATNKLPEDKYEFIPYRVEQIVFDQEGNFWFSSEQEKRSVKSSVRGQPGQQMASTIVEYYNFNIYLAGFLADGSVLWQNKIVKDQYTTNNIFSWASYKAFCMNGNFYVLYNILPYTSGTYVKLKKSYTILASCDKLGQVRTQKVASFVENKVIITPRSAIIPDSKTLLVPGIGEKYYRIAKLSFE